MSRNRTADWQADWENETPPHNRPFRKAKPRLGHCFTPATGEANGRASVYLVLPSAWTFAADTSDDLLAFPTLERAWQFVRERMQGQGYGWDKWNHSLEILEVHVDEVAGGETSWRRRERPSRFARHCQTSKLFLVASAGLGKRRWVTRDREGKLCQLRGDYNFYPDSCQQRYRAGVAGIYADREQAEERLAAETRAWWQGWLEHPWFSVRDMSSLGPELLRDLVLDLGLEPPVLEDHACCDEAWLLWWERTGPAMNGWQRERFLAALDLAPPVWQVEELELRE